MTRRNVLLSKEFFPSLLELEVKRSLRYQNFLSLLLMEATPGPSRDNGNEQPSFTDRMVSLVRTQVRDTDLIGTARENTITVVLLHTDRHGAANVANRLNSLVVSYLGPEESSQRYLNFGLACVPTHATDSESLVSVAFGMLEKSKAQTRSRAELEVSR